MTRMTDEEFEAAMRQLRPGEDLVVPLDKAPLSMMEYLNMDPNVTYSERRPEAEGLECCGDGSDKSYFHGVNEEGVTRGPFGESYKIINNVDVTSTLSKEQVQRITRNALTPRPSPAEIDNAIAHITPLEKVGEVTKETGNPKDAIGDTKPDLSLVPAAGLLLEAQAFMDGARKYGPYNWRDNSVRMRVYIAAAMRHMQQLLDGEDVDPLSTCYHIGHARACLGIIADAQQQGNIIDDRPTPGKAGEMIRRFGDDKHF
jgi:hypothetical protein